MKKTLKILAAILLTLLLVICLFILSTQIGFWISYLKNPDLYANISVGMSVVWDGVFLLVSVLSAVGLKKLVSKNKKEKVKEGIFDNVKNVSVESQFVQETTEIQDIESAPVRKKTSKKMVIIIVGAVAVILLAVLGIGFLSSDSAEGNYVAVSDSISADGEKLDIAPLDYEKVSIKVEEDTILFNYYGTTYKGVLIEEEAHGKDNNEFAYTVDWGSNAPDMIEDANHKHTGFEKFEKQYAVLRLQYSYPLGAWMIIDINFDTE